MERQDLSLGTETKLGSLLGGQVGLEIVMMTDGRDHRAECNADIDGLSVYKCMHVFCPPSYRRLQAVDSCLTRQPQP